MMDMLADLVSLLWAGPFFFGVAIKNLRLDAGG